MYLERAQEPASASMYVSSLPRRVIRLTLIKSQLSNAEMYKVVPEILRLYTVEMAHDKPWKTYNATFVLQSNVICNVTRREHSKSG